MKKIILLIVLAIFTTSCSSPLNKKYSEETLEQDAKAIKESGKLNEEDFELIAGWIVKSKLQGTDLTEKTYKEILNDAKDYKKEQKELAEKTRIEEEEKKKRLGSALTVAMYDKGFQKSDWEDYLTYSFAFENKTEKDIRAFKGSLTINDLFDTEIKSISLTVDDEIKAYSVFKATYTSDYNQFSDEDQRFKNKKIEDLKIVWYPEKIIFTDGTTLE